jgi:hypothetical protein
MTVRPPAPPLLRFAAGVTGHRETDPAIAANPRGIAEALAATIGRIDDCVRAETSGTPAPGPPRLYTLLAHGVDQIAATHAAARGWEIVSPLPFGRSLNVAINAMPHTGEDAQALLAGREAADPAVEQRAEHIRRWSGKARLFELAERDGEIERLLLAMLDEPRDTERLQRFSAAASARAALAGRIMIEQSDLIVGVWDGRTPTRVGGTGHTIVTALEMGTPALLIDPARPDAWFIASSIEELAGWQARLGADLERLAAVVRTAFGPDFAIRAAGLNSEAWHGHSSRPLTIYRRVEALFGGEPRPFRSLEQAYESPSAIAAGSAAPLLDHARAVLAADPAFVDAVASEILPAFAWADGISARLSDAYRSGMTANFVLSALAIIVGIAYLPLGISNGKWIFAVAEFALLASILVITWLGGRRRLHGRWFETRRVAEYLRHAPIMLLTGVVRAAGRWPRGAGTTWPEATARHAFRALGLPRLTVTRAFLTAALRDLLAPHVVSQRLYHEAKATRLAKVHHHLDRLAATLFKLAVVSVSVYLVLKGGAALHVVPHDWPATLSPLFTFLGVALPTMGAAIAGIRFFGDFERFAAISQVTAGKLAQIEMRIEQLLAGPESALDYGGVSRLAHEIDEVVVSEIESWQAVFSGKHIALPA